MIAKEDVSLFAAARARMASNAHESHVTKPRQTEIKFATARIVESDEEPRRKTLARRGTTMAVKALNDALSAQVLRYPCFRGINPYLVMTISQWYIAAFIDFFMSGQPTGLQPGYGCSSVVVTVAFGCSWAIWTHYAVTQQTGKAIDKRFPKGREVLVELFPVTVVWAMAEQITMSLPLALSRKFELRDYAWTPSLWNSLDPWAHKVVVLKFVLVWIAYMFLTAFASIPATMTLRRVHASMLPADEKAIVPYYRGDASSHISDEVSATVPGLSMSKAWSTIRLEAYIRIIKVYIQYFAAYQALHAVCWFIQWGLYDYFETDQYKWPFSDASSFRRGAFG